MGNDRPNVEWNAAKLNTNEWINKIKVNITSWVCVGDARPHTQSTVRASRHRKYEKNLWWKFTIKSIWWMFVRSCCDYYLSDFYAQPIRLKNRNLRRMTRRCSRIFFSLILFSFSIPHSIANNILWFTSRARFVVYFCLADSLCTSEWVSEIDHLNDNDNKWTTKIGGKY